MLKLYDHPFSPYAQKVKIALREKGIAFSTEIPGGIGAGTTTGEFPAASPRAEVPALIDGETRIFDSTIILEYVEDKWPEPALLPKAPDARAHVRMIEEVLDTHFEAITWGLSEIRNFRRASGAEAAMMEAKAEAQIRGYYSWLERQFAGKAWLNGEAFGWGDLVSVPYVRGAVNFGFAPSTGSLLADWLARAEARPSVAATQKEAADLIARGMNMGDVAKLVEAGLFKREYRDHRLEWMIKSGGLEIVRKGIEKDTIRFSPDLR
jgi:glutathione S-transferase/RNA polymerase-associated protein